MRSVGYDLNTALADLIDNSIAAHAKQIDIRYFNADETPYIAIIDDGDGMSPEHVSRAMQLAGTGIDMHRDATDLGRFGLGLKTASLSQARSITVISKQANSFTALRLDLDSIAESSQWNLQSFDEREIMEHVPSSLRKYIPAQSGTCVLWEKLDRLESVTGTNIRDVDKAMGETAEYLGLVFHRYLKPYPSDGITALSITINGAHVPEIDPFLMGNTQVQSTPPQMIPGTEITLTGYTLPYQNKLSIKDKQRLNLKSGVKGHTLNDSQGFYIYRANRLITWGSWFRLLPRKELTKLSRVRVDIPNSFDSEWTLDIKKSTARPPKIVLEAMKRYVNALAKPSREVQKYRGRKTSSDPYAHMWDVMEIRGGSHQYAINEQNPMVKSFMETLDEQQLRDFAALRTALAFAMPIEDIQSKYASDESFVSAATYPREALVENAKQLWRLLKNGSFTSQTFVQTYKGVEPFSLHPEAEAILMEASNDNQ